MSSALLAVAVTRVAAAQSVYVSGTPSTTAYPSDPYAGSQTAPTTAATLVGTATGLSLNGVLANGGFVTTDSGPSSLVYEYASNNSTSVVTGPTTGDFVTSAGNSSQSYRAANFGGMVYGQATRYVPTSTTSAGSDAYLYVPSVGTTVIGTQGVLAAANASQTPNGNIYYNYPVTATVNGTAVAGTYRNLASVGTANGITSAPTAINAAGQVLLTANRYTGVAGQTLAAGTDAFLFTPTTGTTTGSLSLMGLTGAPYYYYNNTIVGYAGGASAANANNYQSSNSTPVALDAAGVVTGTTTRYEPNTPSVPNTLNNFGLGTDAWIYSGAAAIGTTAGTAPVGTVQVGLTGSTTQAAQGGYYSATVTFGNGSTGLYEASAVYGVSAAGAVTGTSNVYSANASTSTTPPALGTDAWQFKPTLAGGSATAPATASGFVTTAAGTYVQLGLTGVPSGTTIGYQSTATTNAGTRSQSIAAANAAGDVAGTTSRYLAGSASAVGTDAWYYNGTAVSLITPVANPAYSTYVNSATSSSSSLNATLSASGVVAGTQTRYLAGNTTSLGSDVFAYSPVTSQTVVIASPALIANDADFAAFKAYGTAAEYFNGAVKSVGDNGLVVGTFTAYEGSSTGNTSIGSYVFAWTPQAGTVVLGSTTGTTGLVLTLNTSSGTTNINVGNVYADAAGDIFGQGYLTGGTTPEVYEFAVGAAVPEPTTAALLAAALLPLARRRRRR